MNETQVCSKCGVEKPYSSYVKDKYKGTGITSQCKECRNAHQNDPESVKQAQKKYYDNNRQKRIDAANTWNKNNRSRVNVNQSEKRKTKSQALREDMAVCGVRSMFEASTYRGLEERGIEFGYETDRIKYVPIPTTKSYTPDFVLTKKDGSKLYIETKGYFRSQDRVKHIAVRESNPDLDIRFVFMNANVKLSKLSKTTYAAWCDKHGFKWAHGKIPDEWLKE